MNTEEQIPLFYIISLKHTSKGDAALTFWCENARGYTWDVHRAGLYTTEGAYKHSTDDNPAVRVDLVAKFWQHAFDFNDHYISVPNTPTVRKALGLPSKLMKETRFASCRMKFNGVSFEKPLDITKITT